MSWACWYPDTVPGAHQRSGRPCRLSCAGIIEAMQMKGLRNPTKQDRPPQHAIWIAPNDTIIIIKVTCADLEEAANGLKAMIRDDAPSRWIRNHKKLTTTSSPRWRGSGVRAQHAASSLLLVPPKRSKRNCADANATGKVRRKRSNPPRSPKGSRHDLGGSFGERRSLVRAPWAKALSVDALILRAWSPPSAAPVLLAFVW